MSKIVEIFADKSALVARAAALIETKLLTAITNKKPFNLALAGGSTPKPLYELLAKSSVPVTNLHVFWGDERYVPPTDPQSNERMAREAWLNKGGFPSSNIHAVPTSSNDPAVDATKYEQVLLQHFGTDAPRFDVILLGMGDDGHTASLFPGTPALQVGDRLVTVGNKDGQPRITFTVPLINQARCVLFLVAGENKRPALAQVFAEEGDANQYPSRLIAPADELYWFLDAAAGEAFKT
ncbi:MAG: 6-phosphogluconolactonase [Cyanobacteria bacterium P01_H01_bin.15]